MEFKFNVNDVFKHPVIVITNTLVPPGFSGDKRALWDAQSKVSQVVNAMGEASATAQGLTKPITTAERLRNSEHRLYLLIDQTANGGKGAVTGMLKTGEKGLYVFDREGQHYQVSPGCVLDFYVHESRQRTGLGKRLFQHMLETEKTEPVKMAIDRPSEKFLGFLNKYYDLNTPVKQMNNFVVFDGFFQRSPEPINTVEVDTSSASRPPSKKESANGLQHFSSPYGRYGAPRPPCSMGQIIHNDTSVVNKGLHEASGVKSAPATNLGSQMYSQSPYANVTQSTPNMQYSDPQYSQYMPIQNNNQNLSQTQAYIKTTQQIENPSRNTIPSQQGPDEYQAYQASQNLNVQSFPQQVPCGYQENSAYARGDMSLHQHNLKLNQNSEGLYTDQNQMQSSINQSVQKLNKQDHTIPYNMINQNENIHQSMERIMTPVSNIAYNQQLNSVNNDLNRMMTVPNISVASPEFNAGQARSSINTNVSSPNIYYNNMQTNSNNQAPNDAAPQKQVIIESTKYGQPIAPQYSQQVLNNQHYIQTQNQSEVNANPTSVTAIGQSPSRTMPKRLDIGAFGDTRQENIIQPIPQNAQQTIVTPSNLPNQQNYIQSDTSTMQMAAATPSNSNLQQNTYQQSTTPLNYSDQQQRTVQEMTPPTSSNSNMRHVHHIPSTTLQHQESTATVYNNNNTQFSPNTAPSVIQTGYNHQASHEMRGGSNTNMTVSNQQSGTILSQQQIDPKYMAYNQLNEQYSPSGQHINQQHQQQQMNASNIKNSQNMSTPASERPMQSYENNSNLKRNTGYNPHGAQIIGQ